MKSKKPLLLCWALLLLVAWRELKSTEFSELWGNPTILSAGWQDAWVPQIAVDSFGNGLSLWYRYDNDIPRIQFSRYSALNGSWTPIGQVQTLSTADKAAVEPQLAIDGSGNAIGVWTIADPNFFNRQIQSARYNAATEQWTPIPDLEILSDDIECNAPQIAVDKAGNGIAVWQLWDDSGTFTVQAAYYDVALGDWVRDGSGKPLLKNLSTGTFEFPWFPYPQIAMDNSGNAIIVWQKKVGSFYGVETTRYYKFDWAAWDPTALREYLSVSNRDAYWPNIAMDNAGDATVVWQLFQPTGFPGIFQETVQAACYSSSQQDWIRIFGIPFVKSIETYFVTDYSEVPTTDIAMDAHGNAFIVWQGYTNFIANTIRSTRYESSISWDSWTPTRNTISSSNLQSLAPRIAMDAAGNGIAAWLIVDDNVNLRLQVSCYDQRTDLWLDPEIAPIILPEGHDALFYQIAMDQYGDALIVWQQSEGIKYRIRSVSFEKIIRPQNVSALQIIHRFPRQADLVNIIRWDVSDPSVIRYELYSDQVLSCCTGCVSHLCNSMFYHHCRKPCIQDNYYVVAVDSFGDKSKPSYISVP